MARVVIDHMDEAAIVAFPEISGISCHGDVETRAVVAEADRPILLWRHDLAAGAELDVERPDVDHGFYVLDGSVEADGKSLAKGGFIAAEHLGRAAIRAGAQGAALLHFHRPDGHPEKPKRPGGHIHVVDGDGILRVSHPDYGHKGTLWANSDCPTCELWLHKSEFDKPKSQKGSTHWHSSDEIIFVLDGEMLVGNQTLRPGTALAIDANTRYGFGVGEAGLAFLNFRPRESFYVELAHKDEPPIDERVQWRTAVML